MLPDPKIVNHKLYALLHDECSGLGLLEQDPDIFEWLCHYADAHFDDSAAFVGKTYHESAKAHEARYFELQAEALRVGREMIDAT